MYFYLILTTLHIIGTILGVGGITFEEIFYLKSVRDGKINQTESSFFRLTFTIIKIGTFLLVISGFGFLVYYRLIGKTELLYNPLIWAKLLLVIIIAINSVLIMVRKIPLWLASPISFVSWYGAMMLGIFRNVEISFLEMFYLYVISIIIVGFFLDHIKKVMNIKNE